MSLNIEQFKQDFKIGDKVLFAKGGKQDDNIYIGEVVKIEGMRIDIKSNTGRTISRYKSNLWNLQEFIDSHPEYII